MQAVEDVSSFPGLDHLWRKRSVGEHWIDRYRSCTEFSSVWTHRIGNARSVAVNVGAVWMWLDAVADRDIWACYDAYREL